MHAVIVASQCSVHRKQTDVPCVRSLFLIGASPKPHRSLTEASPIAYRLTPRGDFGEQQNLGEEPRSVTEGSADITVHRTDVPKPLSGSVGFYIGAAFDYRRKRNLTLSNKKSQ